MHLLATETHSLDAAEAAMDLGQTRADLVFLSFSDSDLGALASAWQAMDEAERPSLRLANLGRLRHPMSVDLYLDRVVAHARCVVVRLLGALEYFRYGAEEISALCVREGIPLAFVPGDGRDDAQLASLSTVPPHQRARLDAYLREGGPLNAASALRLAASLAGLCADANLPALPMASAGEFALASVHDGRPVAAVIFYRAHLLAGDTAPITALAAALAKRGLQPRALYVSSLKDAEAAATVREYLNAWRPAVILNATAFAARTDGGGSPLDVANVPVLQVMLSGSTREAWAASSRGASANDLAMQVVLPELDGRLFTTAISFKSDNAAVAELEYARVVHRPDADGIALAAERAAGWVRLARTPRAERRVAIVLSDYPAAGQRAHAVGLDTFASAEAMLADLRDAGYNIGHMPPNGALRGLMADAQPVRLGNVVLAVQPARDESSDPRRTYHSADAPPCERYTAFYRWLRETFDAHVMVHLGTHGTLEWLPGKAVALTASCAPVALIGGLPVVYPFIVNNPGEAAMAKRRLGAVVIGHLTPPLRRAGAHGDLGELERSIDEYAAADGLDRRRTASLRRDILDRAASLGIAEEAGIAADAPEDDALARLDAYLCDLKDLQLRDGLHVFGRAPGEREGLL
ncbi:MAG: cobaltochelatase subunit CobN, partial [Acidisphaera sp.]|nr:cobaltochelatase subunit CobN [Acidisphaera sp.]